MTLILVMHALIEWLAGLPGRAMDLISRPFAELTPDQVAENERAQLIATRTLEQPWRSID